MKRKRNWVFIVICVFALAPGLAYGKPGPVKFSTMYRFENHSKIADSAGNYGNESFSYFMLSVFRELDKNVIGNVFYLNRYSFDDEEFVSHVGGLSLIRIFNPHVVGSLGYTYSSSPEISYYNAAAGLLESNTAASRDRVMASVIYNFNPDEKRRPKFSLTTTFSSVTNIAEQETLMEKIGVKFPAISQRIEGDLGYTFAYSLNNTDQLTNQISGSLTYKYSNTTKLSLGAIYIDNVYENNQGDDTVVQFTVMRSLR